MTTGPPRLPRALRGYALAAVLLPFAQILARPATGWVWAPSVATLFAIATLVIVGPSVRTPAFAWLGGAIVATCAWLLPQATAGPTTLVLGMLIGLGLTLAVPRLHELRERDAALFLGVGVLQFMLLTQFARVGATLCGALYGVAMLTVSIVSRPGPRPQEGGRRPVLAIAGGVLLAVLSTCWVGANTMTATWFGRLTTHGPRQGSLVAVTFDDGPDVPFTLQVRDVLDRYGVKGTFFTVGKALDAAPDVALALHADGHLLGNHSYLHDALRWLDPRYPELARGQRAFKRRLGLCPAFFRPPHGQHTPFMAGVVGDHHMTMVGWDVSGGDWATSDPALVARRVLRKVRPGAIILLHDGIDGNLHADRSVVVRALPLILEGLRARRLQAVRLDRLLGRPGYLSRC